MSILLIGLVTLANIMAFEPPAVPRRYDHEPRPGSYYVVERSPATVRKRCGLDLDVIFACTVKLPIKGKVYVIYIRNDLTPEAHAYALRHEKAHVNGWRH